jgi:hypothetical protein
MRNGHKIEQEDTTEYAERFVRFSDQAEKLLRKAVWTGIALIVATQLLLSIPAFRQWAVKIERLEGVPIERMDRETAAAGP